ncbi:hypothetical protein EHQ95_08690 [Leptospira vanthielii]|uniref:Uncharacterized protein n=1 Tax=Leptospira vanthielii TaxID=293085 RepID=A0ABY2NNM9_9LEPT|nr:hypothetical protein EHQ95_08690 [Leptospira vanthielii]
MNAIQIGSGKFCIRFVRRSMVPCRRYFFFSILFLVCRDQCKFFSETQEQLWTKRLDKLDRYVLKLKMERSHDKK